MGLAQRWWSVVKPLRLTVGWAVRLPVNRLVQGALFLAIQSSATHTREIDRLGGLAGDALDGGLFLLGVAILWIAAARIYQ
jgi:hypothetical protein